MVRVIFIAIVSFLLVGASGARADLQDDVEQAADILQRFQEIQEEAIPSHVLRDAKGIAFLTVTKAGFGFSGRIGKGVVVARTDRGWSGPSAIGTGGVGFGLQIGVKVTEFVLILNTREAVNAFAQSGNVTVGGQLSAAAGPFGRTAAADVALQAAIYSYSRSQGAFAGVSIEGTLITTRNKANTEFYGRSVEPKEVLRGKVKAPAGAKKLLSALSRI